MKQKLSATILLIVGFITSFIGTILVLFAAYKIIPTMLYTGIAFMGVAAICVITGGIILFRAMRKNV